jgi:hypothetical protein
MTLLVDRGFFWNLIRPDCLWARQREKQVDPLPPPPLESSSRVRATKYQVRICKRILLVDLRGAEWASSSPFPALDGADLAFEVDSNLLPGIETLAASSVPCLQPGLRTSFAHVGPWKSTAGRLRRVYPDLPPYSISSHRATLTALEHVADCHTLSLAIPFEELYLAAVAG